MRTTIDLPDELFKEVKAAAALSGIPLREYIEAAVRDRLRGGGKKRSKAAWIKELNALYAEIDAQGAGKKGSAGPFSREETYKERLARFR